MSKIPGNQFQYKFLVLLTLYILLCIVIFLQFSIQLGKFCEISENSYQSFPFYIKLKNLKSDVEFLTNKNSKKIFFIETHLDSVRRIDNARQACSIESAG
jgi:hypothetical protein